MTFLLFIYVTLAVSWNIVGGYAGQLNLGHAAFMGTGAYTLAMLMNAGVNPYVCMLFGGVMAVAISTVIIPCFKLRGTYFAVGTLLLPEIIKIIILNTGELGGAGGLRIPVPTRFDISMYYYLAMALALATIFITYKIVNSKIGLTFLAIGDDEEAAENIGIPTLKYKILALMLSAFFTGIAGSIFAYCLLYIEPYHVFGIEWTIYPIFMVLLGGIRTMKGPMIGSIIFIALYYVSTIYLVEFSLIVFGALLIGVTIFMPEGLVPKFSTLLSSRKLPRIKHI
jgi:branched-chain amino acid transport system permease protein